MKRKYGFSFSLKRAVGLTAFKQKVARKIGIPLTKNGLERKIGGIILKTLLGTQNINRENRNAVKKQKKVGIKN